MGRSLTLEEETRLVEAIMDNSSLNITCIVGRDEETERFYARALECVGRKKAQEESAGQFYRGTLRKGQILETESSIIVLGLSLIHIFLLLDSIHGSGSMLI